VKVTFLFLRHANKVTKLIKIKQMVTMNATLW